MTTIYTFAQSAIEDARSAGRYGTANLYTSAINTASQYHIRLYAYVTLHLQPGAFTRYSRRHIRRRVVSFRFHRIRTHRQAGYFAHSHTAPLAIESGEAAQLTLQPRFVPAQFLSQRDSVRRPRPSPQNGHEIQHHSLPPA